MDAAVGEAHSMQPSADPPDPNILRVRKKRRRWDRGGGGRPPAVKHKGFVIAGICAILLVAIGGIYLAFGREDTGAVVPGVSDRH